VERTPNRLIQRRYRDHRIAQRCDIDSPSNTINVHQKILDDVSQEGLASHILRSRRPFTFEKIGNRLGHLKFFEEDLGGSGERCRQKHAW